MTRILRPILTLLVGAWVSSLHAADWPQWRFDANRSAATEESCMDNPSQLWHLALPYPDPAYDHQYRMCADITYAPVAAHGLVFIPSNVADQVLACDLKTGRTAWRHITDGPVRMAPACVGDMVCFGSDDGCLYAVAARSGELRWKVRGAPEHLPDSRLLVNGRLCSRWPVRGAPVIHGNTVFFGAGVWPEEGVYVSAVDVRTGNLLWRSDKLSYIKNGMSDHGQAYDLSLPPQGYPAVLDGKLAVTSGRSLAAWFDLESGELEPYTCFYVKTNPPRGTWFAAGISSYWIQGGHWFGTRPDSGPPLPEALKDSESPLYWSREKHDNEWYVMQQRPFLGGDAIGGFGSENYYSEPVLTETTAYASEFASEREYFVPRGHTHVFFPTYDRIVARDLVNPKWTSETHWPVRLQRKPVKMRRLVFPIKWELECPLKVLAKGGNRIYAGGQDTVAAIRIPSHGETPKIVWQRSVSGIPVNALIADGTLVVTTHTGDVYAFGAGKTQPTLFSSPASESKHGPYASPRGGFALLLGWGDGQRAKQLATAKDCRVVVLEADSSIAAEARNRLAEQGLYGRKIQVLHASLSDLHLTPHWANQVFINDLGGHGSAEAVLSSVLDTLRPFTGRLEWRADDLQRAVLERLLAKRTGYALEQNGGTMLVRRLNAPEGADDWTHEPSGPENAFASSDRLVKWPLGLLWYSGDIDRYFTPATHFQHERNPYPLVIDGRMFLITGHYIHAVDVYTGMYLWKTEMPRTPWIETYYFDTRYYGRATERHCALARDLFYAVIGDKINAYDTATGELRVEIEVPARFRAAVADTQKTQDYKAQGHRGRIRPVPPWSEVRLHHDLLMAVFDKHLAALDRHTGDLRWSRESTLESTAYAIGQGTLYGVDYDLPKRDGKGDGVCSRLLFALDPATGRTLWKTPVTSRPGPASPPKSNGLRPWLRPSVPVVAYNAKHRLVILSINGNELYAHRADDGSDVWSLTGQTGGDPLRIAPPMVMDDHLLVSQYKGCYGFLLDVRTGKEVGETTGIPRPRTCARVIGNDNLLVYRDAATELYDVDNNRMIGLNSLRSGCTTSFIPAGGIMAAPMLGHGCVCNYPMFASMALYHLPQADSFRPQRVTVSWRNQAEALIAANAATSPQPGGPVRDENPIDLKAFHLINGVLTAVPGPAVRFETKDSKAGYAVRKVDEPIRRATFTFSVSRVPAEGRHGNAFFVCGNGNQPEDWIECRLFYGGRRSVEITGRHAQSVTEEVDFPRQKTFPVTVTVDCKARTVTLAAAGRTLTSRIKGSLDTITHVGFGGANSTNVFTDIKIK